MATTDPTAENASLDDRDRRALTEYLTVLPEIGRVKGAGGLYLVVSQSGSEYLVDARTDTCECPDSQHRDPDGGCKHCRRVAYAVGKRPVPDIDGVDPDLGEHVDRDCPDCTQDLPCWECYRNGRRDLR